MNESSQPVGRRQAPPPDLPGALVFLVVALVAGWLVLVWALVKRPLLDCNEANAGAQALYARHGFSPRSKGGPGRDLFLGRSLG